MQCSAIDFGLQLIALQFQSQSGLIYAMQWTFVCSALYFCTLKVYNGNNTMVHFCTLEYSAIVAEEQEEEIAQHQRVMPSLSVLNAHPLH